MSSFRHVFYSLRKQRGLTQADMAKAIGVSRSAIGMYEQGNREPDFETMEKIADYFNVDLSTLHGEQRNGDSIPFLGSVGCSTGSSMAILEDIACPNFIPADCAFMCRGESMVSFGFNDGDVVYIQRGAVKDDSIGCVRVGDEYLLKKIHYTKHGISLISDIPTIDIDGEQTDYEVIGKAVYKLQAI